MLEAVQQLVVLGASGGWPTAEESCSGFLLEAEGVRIVLDLGYGTLPQLLTRVPDGAVDAVVITHAHPDHCIDLHGLFRLRLHGYPDAPRLPLYCPEQVIERLAGLEPDVDLHDVFDHHLLPGTDAVGPFAIEAVALPHVVPTVGVRLSSESLVIAYATDTGPDEALVDLGRDADVYVLDATDRPGETENDERSLLTAVEAGFWAHEAGARRLLLTHLWPGTDPGSSADRARQTFPGPVTVATRDLVVELGAERSISQHA